MKMSKKGFTMVELLAAIAILGLLMIMAFPTMRAVQSRNEKRKYEEYGHAMLSAAKLYTDSYADDLFPRGYKNDFAVISTTDLAKKDLLKNIGFTDISCIDGDSVIVVAKYGDDYQYCLSMKCKNKTGGVVYQEENKEGICKSYSTKTVTYVYHSSNGDKVYQDKIIAGDDAYYAQNPAKFGNFNFASNHQVFQNWVRQGSSQKFNIGDQVGANLLKSDLTLVAEVRPYRYTVNYSANGGSGNVASHQCDYGANCPLRANGYTKKGSTFQNWKDGTGKTYNAGQNYQNLVETDGGSITLSANWRLNKIYILYNANGASLTEPYLHDFKITNSIINKGGNNKFFSVSYGQKLTTDGLVDYNNRSYINISKANSRMEAGKEWNTAANGSGTSYNQATQYNASDFCDASNGDCTKTLYANWKPNNVTVTFNCNGGSGGGSQTFTVGTPNQKFSKTCTRAGYTMTGWNTAANGSGSSYSVANSVSDNWINKNSPSTTLYAQWRINVVRIYYHVNGGSMTTPYDKSLSISGGQVYKNGAIPIHTVNHGGTVNLCNYNNSSYLNLVRKDYNVPAGAEWNTKADGTGTSYNHSTDYTTASFCDTTNGDCTKNLYVNWKEIPFTCDTSQYPYKTSNKKCYKTLRAALANVPSGGTITLLKNFSDSSNPVFNRSGESAKLDLGNHTLNLTSDPLHISKGTLTLTGGSSGELVTAHHLVNLVEVVGGKLKIDTITIHNKYNTSSTMQTIGLYMSSGTVEMSSGAIKAGTGSNSGHSLVVFNNGGSFNMSGGLLESNSTKSSGHGGSGLRSDKSTSTITGGKIHVVKGGLDRCLLCVHDGGKVRAKGDSQYVYSGSVNYSCTFFYTYGSSSNICYEKSVSLSFNTSAPCTHSHKFSAQSGSIVEKKKGDC